MMRYLKPLQTLHVTSLHSFSRRGRCGVGFFATHIMLSSLSFSILRFYLSQTAGNCAVPSIISKTSLSCVNSNIIFIAGDTSQRLKRLPKL